MAQQIREALAILRRKQVEARTGLSRSTIYQQMADGFFTRAVRIGTRAVGWPLNEVEELYAARIAGKSDDEIRALVRKLEAARKSA